MYNEELKNEFLQWNGSNVEQKRGLFEHIAKFEQACNKDVSDMCVEEYHQCLKASGEAFMNGFIELYRVLESYGQWVVTEKRRPVLWVESCTMYEAYLSDACFPKVWLWPDIAAELLSLYPITEGHEIWPIAVLGWLGLTQRECCALRNEDIDLK